jgi:hypothetical protein
MKRWRVDVSGWHSGTMKWFWFKRNALKFIKSQDDVFISIYDEYTKEKEYFKKPEDSEYTMENFT